MRGCGIILFKEITSKTIVRKFHKVLNDYEIHIKKCLEFKTTHKEIELFFELFNLLYRRVKLIT